jgi:DNA polymerase-3 subunit epsilon
VEWFRRASYPAHVRGFAAVDLETTGLSPRLDRVVEVAVVQLDCGLSPCGEFTTLINPGRDIGATDIHRISARDVAGAPRFEQIAPMLLDVLRGRVVVAHNVQFDLRFLDVEFARMGIGLPELPVMCTMQLAAQCLRGLPARSLAACCLAAGIPLDGAHAAAVDARAVARLLACYARADNRLAAQWARTAADAALVPWPALPPLVTGLVTREIVAFNRAHEVPFLARLVQQLPRAGADVSVESYLAALDTVLEDRRVTATEAESLRDLAVSLGVGADAVITAHQMYLRALAVAAWADGVITDAEYADLGEVARLLGFPATAVDIELTAARGMTQQVTVPVNGRELHAGDAVCITGDTATLRDELEVRATDAGLRVTSAVSRKTRLVVAADPDSESTKARRARELGIPIIAEPVFLTMLQRGVAPAPLAANGQRPSGAPTRPPLARPS